MKITMPIFTTIILFVLYVSINIILRGLGITNNIVLLTTLFLLSHLVFTLFLHYRDGNDSDLNESAFAAIFISVITVLSYMFVGVIPIKYLFYPLKLLPKWNIWINHFIVSLPVSGAYYLAKYILDTT